MQAAVVRKALGIPFGGAQCRREAREPRVVADYLFGLTSAFNRFYQKHPILHAADVDTAVARLYLVQATRIVLRNGLRLLGIPAVEVM